MEMNQQFERSKPVSVIVFGILNIVLGALGLFGALFSLFLFYNVEDSSNPVIKIMAEHPLYLAFTKISIVISSIFVVLLIASGIGLFLLKPWARLCSLAYAIITIVMGIIGLILNFLFLLGPLLETARQSQGPQAAAAVGGAFGGIFGGVLGLLYPILVIIFMTRPKFVAAFTSPNSLSSTQAST